MKRMQNLTMILALGASLSLTAGPALIKASTKGKLETVKELLASGENVNDASNFYSLILNEAADVYNVSAMGHTGFTGCLQVAQMCAGFELPRR